MSLHRLLAANWKMHPPPVGFDADDSPYRPQLEIDIVVFPSALDIARCVSAGLTTGGQAARAEVSGAFTGDISMAMLAQEGCRSVLCGHSERRIHHGETDDQIATQVHSAIEAGLLPILCVGETADERNAGNAEEVVRTQITVSTKDVHSPIVIAYEPVWAIGTGNAATPDNIQTMHATIRSFLPPALRASPVLYGGSVKPDNAAPIFGLPDVDGALVGGSSLDPSTFRALLDLLRSTPH